MKDITEKDCCMIADALPESQLKSPTQRRKKGEKILICFRLELGKMIC